MQISLPRAYSQFAVENIHAVFNYLQDRDTTSDTMLSDMPKHISHYLHEAFNDLKETPIKNTNKEVLLCDTVQLM